MEKELGVLADNKLSMSQQYPGGQGQWYLGVHSEENCQEVKGDLASLLSP